MNAVKVMEPPTVVNPNSLAETVQHLPNREEWQEIIIPQREQTWESLLTSFSWWHQGWLVDGSLDDQEALGTSQWCFDEMYLTSRDHVTVILSELSVGNNAGRQVSHFPTVRCMRVSHIRRMGHLRCQRLIQFEAQNRSLQYLSLTLDMEARLRYYKARGLSLSI